MKGQLIRTSHTHNWWVFQYDSQTLSHTMYPAINIPINPIEVKVGVEFELEEGEEYSIGTNIKSTKYARII